MWRFTGSSAPCSACERRDLQSACPPLARAFLRKIFQGRGIDIGAGNDPLPTPDVVCWDKPQGDATYLATVPDNSFDFVYSSHCLEHLRWPAMALKNWWRILKPGGHLIVVVPHRDLYEKRTVMPSIWNADHKYFWLIERDELPHTLGLLPLAESWLRDYEIISLKKCDEGHTIDNPKMHSDGEYSIEMVLRKRARL